MPRVLLLSQTRIRLADTPIPFRVINRERCSVESRLKIVRSLRTRTTLRAHCHFARSRPRGYKIEEETFNFQCLRARARHNGGLRRAPSFSRLGILSLSSAGRLRAIRVGKPSTCAILGPRDGPQRAPSRSYRCRFPSDKRRGRLRIRDRLFKSISAHRAQNLFTLFAVSLMRLQLRVILECISDVYTLFGYLD